MNGAHFHLILNHLPIVSVLVGTLVMIAAYVLKKKQIKETALGIFLFGSITSLLAFFTGEEAEEVVEDMKGLSETLIHMHEAYAKVFLIFSILLGLISILTLILSIKSNQYAKHGFMLALTISLVLVVLGKQVGNSGGEIRHTEIRNSSLNTNDDVVIYKTERKVDTD